MKIFVDTNIFVAVIEESEGSRPGKQLLNKQIENPNNEGEIRLCTSYLNIIEVRNVLMKKKHKERETAEDITEWLKEHLDDLISTAPDLKDIDNTHQETLLDTRDVIFYQISDEFSAVFASLERELIDHGAKHPSNLV